MDRIASIGAAMPEIRHALGRADVACDEPQHLVNALAVALAVAIEQAARNERIDPVVWPTVAARVAGTIPPLVADLACRARREAPLSARPLRFGRAKS